LFFNNEIDLFARGLAADGAKVEVEASAAVNGYIEELRQLAKLMNEGVLSGDEFDLKKRKLLGI
jgi:DNA-binding PucR family transcriptional regulator